MSLKGHARLHFEMPSIMEECILIVSKAAVGTYMFCLGLFMAINKKIDENWSIGVPITGILWRFIMGPICWGLACLYLGLDGEVLKATIIQATLPPAYLSFYYAQEYRIDIDCISHGEVRIEDSETLNYLDNLSDRKCFSEQGDAITFEYEVDRAYLSTEDCIAVIDHGKKFEINKRVTRCW
ncbi:hypothetical protein AgCh_007069 [Apium graveolens]